MSSGEIRLHCCACEMQALLYSLLLRKSRCGKSFSPLLIFFSSCDGGRDEKRAITFTLKKEVLRGQHTNSLWFFLFRKKCDPSFSFPFSMGNYGVCLAHFFKGPSQPSALHRGKERRKSGATLGFHLRNSHRRHTHFSFPSQQKKSSLTVPYENLLLLLHATLEKGCLEK